MSLRSWVFIQTNVAEHICFVVGFTNLHRFHEPGEFVLFEIIILYPFLILGLIQGW